MKTFVIKLVLCLGLWAGFYACGGFAPVKAAPDGYHSPARVTKAWLVTVGMFVGGTILVLAGNALAQQVDWDIPDGLYLALGWLLLVGGFVWMLLLRDGFRA